MRLRILPLNATLDAPPFSTSAVLRQSAARSQRGRRLRARIGQQRKRIQRAIVSDGAAARQTGGSVEERSDYAEIVRAVAIGVLESEGLRAATSEIGRHAGIGGSQIKDVLGDEGAVISYVLRLISIESGKVRRVSNQ